MDLVSARSNYFPRQRPSAITLLAQEQRKTAAEQRGASLFYRSANRRRPRISAGNAMSVADNFLQKQQKQQNL
jgi:hypothetical protein